MPVKKKALLTLSLFLFAVSPNTHSNQLEEIPLDSWVYPVIDKLHFQGFFPNLFVADKPYTRGEIVTYLRTIKPEIFDNIVDGKIDNTPYQRWLFQRLFDEFQFELMPKGDLNDTSSSLTFRWGSAFNLKSDFRREAKPFHKLAFNAYVGAELDKRFYFHSRARVENHVSQNPSVRARSWTHNDIGGTLDDTYLKYHYKYLDLIFGRQRLQWGPGFSEVDLISPTPPPFDMLRFKATYKALRFQFFFTRLDDAVNPSTPFDTVPRYFSAHRLGIQPWHWLELNLSEVVLYGGPGRKLEWYYLMPFVPFYGEQYNNFNDDNPLWSIDWTLAPLKNFAQYGEFLIDDFQIDCIGGGCSEPQQIGIRLGFLANALGPYKNNSINLEYSRINNYVYGQNRYYNLYLYHNVPIGAPLGPSGDYVLLRYRQYFSKNFDAGFSAEYRRKGQDSIAVQTTTVPFAKFPLGVVEKTLTFQFSAAYQYKANLFARLDFGTKNGNNAGNVSGAAGRDRFIGLQLGYNFWWENRY